MLTLHEQFQAVYVLVRHTVRSERKDDVIRQRHLPDGFLKTQGTSTFAIVNPECPISPMRPDKETIIFAYAGFSTRRLPDSYLTS